MSNTLDSAKLSALIQSATKEMVNRMETFIQSVQDDPVGSDTITVILNGEKTVLSRENYNALKEQNAATKMKLKTDINALTDQFRASIQQKPAE